MKTRKELIDAVVGYLGDEIENKFDALDVARKTDQELRDMLPREYYLITLRIYDGKHEYFENGILETELYFKITNDYFEFKNLAITTFYPNGDWDEEQTYYKIDDYRQVEMYNFKSIEKSDLEIVRKYL